MGDHNIEADWASAEVARMLEQQTASCLTSPDPPPAGLHTAASRELETNRWPLADGVVSFQGTATSEFVVAVEYKRVNESIHGILTALGQALAYVEKGYSGAAIVIPATYPTHVTPGPFLEAVIERTSPGAPVGVFVYGEPDTTNPSPYEGKITCVRRFAMGAAPARGTAPTRRTETQWAHVREGSTTRSGAYRFLQTAKRFDFEAPPPPEAIPAALLSGVNAASPGAVWERYLSSTSNETPQSQIWRQFWFRWLATPEVLVPWAHDGTTYSVPTECTRLELDDGTGMQRWFGGKSNSIKDKLVEKLNDGSLAEAAAWQRFAVNLHDRAHSIREDLDSGMAHLGLIGADGRPTDLGYRFVDVCERSGGPNSEAARELFAAILIQAGRFGSFLHYVYRLSDEAFKGKPHRFAAETAGRWRFDELAYLRYVETEMAVRLKVLRKVLPRAGTPRKPFQAELALLRQYRFVRKFRVGVGLEIDWVRVQEAVATPI